MKVLLIYPRYKYSGPSPFAPLGLLHIAAVLREAKHQTQLIDMTFQEDFKLIKKAIPCTDIVGISISTPLANTAYKIVKYIRDIKPNMTIIGGGPEATIRPRDILANGFDIAIIGEGDLTILDLLQKLNDRESLHTVKGIAYKEGAQIKLVEPREFMQNIGDLPLPAFDMIDWKKYRQNGVEVLPLITSRGCPFNCFFCQPVLRKMFGNKIRQLTPVKVINQIKCAMSESGMDSFFFVDDTFAFNKDWVKEFCNEILKDGLKISWGCQSRVNSEILNKDMLRLMKKSGLTGMSLGVESGSQKILDFLQKGIKVEDTHRAFKLCRKMGIYTHAYIIFGTPTETKKDLANTVRLIKKIKPDSIGISRLTPTPGSQLYDYVMKNNTINVNNLEDFDYYVNSFPIKLKDINKEDLDLYEKKAYDVLRGTTLVAKIKKYLLPMGFVK